MRRWLSSLVIFIAGVAAASAGSGVGLVLSGGGSKGIAHIGVIQALEDNDIPIDYVTGTSMGAIVGGLYAMGYTPAEMLDLILSRDFSYWSTGRIDPDFTFYFNREEPSPVMINVPIGPKPGPKVPASLISPLPMNFAFMELFAPATAACGGDFDRLMVPFRCVASDIDARRMKVLRGGSLGDAIRASMSFPIVFQPTEIDSTLLYDGGIYDNFPVDVMLRDFAPDVIFGVTVNTPTLGPQYSLMDQLENLVIQRADYNLPPRRGMKLHIDLRQFGLLDFPKAREIYRIGYEHAVAVMDSLKTRISGRTSPEVRRLRRDAFRARYPYTRFGSVEVSGGTPRQNDYLRYLFHPRRGCDTIGIGRARDAYYRAISSGKLADLSVQAPYCDSTGLFALRMRAAVKSRFRLGVGGYITSSANSFLYASAGFSSMSFSSLDASLSGWLGQSVMAARLGGRLFLHTPLPSALEFAAVVSRTRYTQGERLFFEDRSPTFLIDRQIFGRLGWSMATGRVGKLTAAVGYGWLRDSYFRDSSADSYRLGRNHSDYALGQALLRYSSNTLDDQGYPTSGHSYMLSGMGMLGHSTLHRPDYPRERRDERWLQGELRTRNYIECGRHFSLGLESDILLSTRGLSPTYGASVAAAPEYTPTPSAAGSFNPALRAFSFIAAGVVPVYRYNESLSARVGAYGFLPVRRITGNTVADVAGRGRPLSDPEVWAEAAVSYRFPVGTLSGYASYTTSPGDHWRFGLSLGVFILPPKFLR
ncbi:MAG: patatin-like phospholipase family protein [Bacteroides sp.]|nr:patatin-like phospholipase family protein [Bacteroides sp.]MCM1096002.1 patatin-like phospholipase family protein [Terasakiella sp.]